MQNEILFSSCKGREVWHALNTISVRYDQEQNPLELEMRSCEILKNVLDIPVRNKVESMINKNNLSYLVIRNFLSIDSLPLTPTDDSTPPNTQWRIPAAALLGILRLSGHSARSFMDEMRGRLCHMVMPARNDKKSLLRSTKKLGFHTEVVNGYFKEDLPKVGQPISPEVFGLLGLRNPDGIATTLLPIDVLLNSLDSKTIAALMRPDFSARSQSSFDKEICIDNVPVLKCNEAGIISMRYSQSKLKANNEQANEALSALSQTLSNHPGIKRLVLNPGDVAIINNRTCVHGRSEISGTERFDGMDRWLIRIYGYRLNTLPLLTTLPDKKHVMTVNI